jgi:hypothetical protein
MEFWVIATAIIGFAALIISTFMLYFILQIEKNSKFMKEDVWGQINDLALFLNAEQIIRLRKENSISSNEVESLINYWEVEHIGVDENSVAKENKDWQRKYNKTYSIMLDYLKRIGK